MRKLRFLLVGAALTISAFAAQRPAAAIPFCRVGGPPYSCLCPNGHVVGCVANAAACTAACTLN